MSDSMISSQQNKPINIDRLAAQRELYSRAKKYLSLSLFLSVIVMVVLSTIVLVLNSRKIQATPVDYSWVLIMASFFLIVINDIVLLPLINTTRETAAKIQELFDCDVLALPWNNMAGEKPANEIIKPAASEHLSNHEQRVKLRDWYGDEELLNQVSTLAGKLICQRSNIAWDVILRKRYVTLLIMLAGVVTLIPIVLGLFLGLSMQDFFLMIVATLMPAFVFLVQQTKEHKNSITTLERLSSKRDELWQQLVKTKQVSELEIRQLQDEIYNHRKTSALVFDWLYNKAKKSQEDSMYYATEASVKEYLRG